MALVQVVADDFEHAVAVEEIGVDRPHRCILQAGDPFFDVEHQDLVQLRNRLGRPVIAPHQHFRGALTLRGSVAETVSHRTLQVEHQPVLTSPGDQVQPGTDQLQHTFVSLELLDLEGGCQSAGGQLGPVAAQASRPGNPQNHLQITQTTRTFLAVRFERVRGVFKFLMPLAHLQRLGAQERTRIHGLRVVATEHIEAPPRSAQVARFEQRRAHSDIALCLGHAFFDCAHAGADFQANVPAGGV